MRRHQLVRVATAFGLAAGAVGWLATVAQAQTARVCDPAAFKAPADATITSRGLENRSQLDVNDAANWRCER